MIKNSEGKPVKSYGVFRDITKRKQAELQYQASLRYFESMDRINRAIQGKNDLERAMQDFLKENLSLFECDQAFLLYSRDPKADSYRVPFKLCRPEYPGFNNPLHEIPMDKVSAGMMLTLLDSDRPVSFGAAVILLYDISSNDLPPVRVPNISIKRAVIKNSIDTLENTPLKP